MIDIEELKAAALAATPGPWAKGRTTHHTISKHPDFNGYEIAEFHHAHDAELLDFANPSAILELIERLEKAEKDAERYRWLRDVAEPADWENIGYQYLHLLDATIDAAIKEQGK